MSDFTSPDLPFSPPFPFPLSGRVGQLQLTCPAFPQRKHLILLMSTVQDPAVCLLLPHFPHLPSATVSTPNSYSVFPSREFNFLPVPVDSKSLNSRCCSSPPRIAAFRYDSWCPRCCGGGHSSSQLPAGFSTEQLAYLNLPASVLWCPLA